MIILCYYFFWGWDDADDSIKLLDGSPRVSFVFRMKSKFSFNGYCSEIGVLLS